MKSKPYGMICPITRACEILEPRWTIPILVGLWAGATKFNELRREVGSISPALLSKRLKELEELGLVERIADPASGSVDYLRTDAALALEPALNALAEWAQCTLEAEFAMCTASASNLMWNLRKCIVLQELPARRTVIQFRFSDEVTEYDTHWVLAKPQCPLEICTSIPGYEIDLFIETSVISLLGILQGRTTIGKELELGEMFVSGDPVLSRTIARWLIPGTYSHLAGIEKLPDHRKSALHDKTHA